MPYIKFDDDHFSPRVFKHQHVLKFSYTIRCRCELEVFRVCLESAAAVDVVAAMAEATDVVEEAQGILMIHISLTSADISLQQLEGTDHLLCK